MARRFRKYGLRNRLEEAVHASLSTQLGSEVEYEPDTLEYEIPARTAKYTPDFKLRENVYVETKGLWDLEDRQKILHVLDQYPDVIVIMVFSNSEKPIYKGSKTTYGMWCNEHLIPWWDSRWGPLPDEYLDLNRDTVAGYQPTKEG